VTVPDPEIIRTARLDLVPATADALRADLLGRVALSGYLGVDVPPAWPPPLYDESAVQWSLARIAADPAHERWGTRYFVRRTPGPIAIGAGGFKGPPQLGAVEIGYAVLPQFQRQGLATEAGLGLVVRAFQEPTVEQVLAETLPNLRPSIAVLERIGFRLVGAGSEEGVVRYAIRREDLG
jgi:RimJ/RimL family protein N-acetyltransferase